MNENVDKEMFLQSALKDERNRKSKVGFYSRNVVNPLWGFMVDYFLRFVDSETYKNVVKLDLWDETVAKFTTIRQSILQRLKPKRLYYIEFVEEFCKRFHKMYDSKNEFVINDNILNWPFRKETLDAIIDVSTSDHLDSKNFEILMQKYYKSLKRNGFLYLLHLNSEYFNMKKFLGKETDYPSFARNEKYIEKIIYKNGFKIVKKKFLFPFVFDSYFASQAIYIRFLFLLRLLFENLIFYILTEILQEKNLNIFIGYLLEK